MSRLNLNAIDIATNGLSKSQASSLTKDIITFETIAVNGVNVLAPKIYLSASTKNRLAGSEAALANGSVIYAKDSITLNSAGADLVNSGSIISAGAITMNLKSLTNSSASLNLDSKAQIKSGANLNITALNNIKNLGAKISATNNLNLTSTAGNITNSSLIETNDQTLLNSNSDSYQRRTGDDAPRTTGNTSTLLGASITSTQAQTAEISGGNITINAANDFTNLAANITSTGNTSITAGDDININTLQLRNRTESSWGSKKKGGYSITDNTTNVGSEIVSGGIPLPINS
jgi:filamentous hemagglutinin